MGYGRLHARQNWRIRNAYTSAWTVTVALYDFLDARIAFRCSPDFIDNAIANASECLIAIGPVTSRVHFQDDVLGVDFRRATHLDADNADIRTPIAIILTMTLHRKRVALKPSSGSGCREFTEHDSNVRRRQAPGAAEQGRKTEHTYPHDKDHS
jgi:hypothetical protein